MPIVEGTGPGEYPITIGYLVNGEPADDITFNRPHGDLDDRTQAIKTLLDNFAITEVVGLEAALQGASPMHGNLGKITTLDYGANPGKIFSVDGSGNVVLIPNTLQGENNTASNLGLGEGKVFQSKSGVDLQLRSLKAGSNVEISQDANEITIASSPGDIGQFTKFVKQTTGSDIPVNKVLAWNDDGTAALADANIASLSDLCGFSKELMVNSTFSRVIKLGNIPGVLVGLGAKPGDKVYLGETPGEVSLTPPPLTGENSIIVLGTAEPPTGVATVNATDLFYSPSIVVEGGSL